MHRCTYINNGKTARSNQKHYNLPGQGLTIHIPKSVESPKQRFPLYDGRGFVHDLNLLVMPCPHVLLHVVQWAHGLQLPCTV